MTEFSTRAVHGAESREEEIARPHTAPIHQSSSFTFASVREGIAAFEGSGEYTYTRKGNPTVRALERHLAALEAAPVPTPHGDRATAGRVDCRFFSSGMAAISAVALGVAGGGRIVCQGGIYGTTETMIGGLGRFGVEVGFVRVGDMDALREAVGRPPAPRLVYVETPANPLLQVTDVEAAADHAHEAGALLAVDATFATPALLRPLAWGADLSIHSTTKFIAGHGVVLGGAVSARPELMEDTIAPMRSTFGGSADPFAAWLTLLGAKTLSVRMDRHVANAAALATFLDAHPRVARVFRPDPAALPPGQLAAAGPMLSFDVRGGGDAALGMIDRLELVTLAPTLGNLDTLIQHPWSMSHVVLPEDRRLEMGIGPGIVRVSVGIEAAEDLVADFDRALSS